MRKLLLLLTAATAVCAMVIVAGCGSERADVTEPRLALGLDRTQDIDEAQFWDIGWLGVMSTPSGAAISLDGVPTGYVTPRLLSGVPMGTHRLDLTKSGYAPWSVELAIVAEETTYVLADLGPAPKPKRPPRAGMQ